MLSEKRGAQQNLFVNLSYINFFYCKFTVTTKIDIFNGYINTTHAEEACLRFAIYYFISP